MSLLERVLGYGDDALIAAQRLGEWCSRAPEMEEDVALTNIALDQLGTARLLLTYAGELEGLGRDEDDLAYLRGDREFRNLLLVELDNGDFAVTMGKLLFLSAYQKLLYDRLAEAPTRDGAPASSVDSRSAGGSASSGDSRSAGGSASSGGLASDGVERLAEIAAKARKESAYHLDHSSLWTIRLGDGTAESHRRMQDAVDALWPYTAEMFDTEPDLRADWLATVEDVLARATLDRPADGWTPVGGRHGVHTEGLSILLAEMQVLHRAHPGARW